MRYRSDSPRTIQGEGLETHLKTELQRLLGSKYDVKRLKDRYDEFFTQKDADAEIAKHSSFISEIDQHYGDILISFGGKLKVRISVKSSTGTTTTFSKAHVEEFCKDDDVSDEVDRYFAFAHTDSHGIPLGPVCFVRCDVARAIYERHSRDGSDGSMFVGLQQFLCVAHSRDSVESFAHLVTTLE